MKVFLSWSGELSHKVAEILKAWIPSVLPNVEAWLSSEDISKGSRWASVLAERLEKSSYGIVVAVPGNIIPVEISCRGITNAARELHGHALLLSFDQHFYGSRQPRTSESSSSTPAHSDVRCN